MKMNNPCMIETAFDNQDELNRVVETLISKKLVASCQVVESQSTWNWHNEKESSQEYLLLMKTRKPLANQIYEVIRKIHSYDCFEFAIFDLTSPSSDYLNWINQETSEKITKI